jgi:transcriptional regulator with XRE-family HTH domain
MDVSEKELYRRLGRAVAERRAELGLTQGQIAAQLGLSRASVANLENGRQRIMVHQLYALANALKFKSILDLVPPTWSFAMSLPEVKVSGPPLSPRQQSSVEALLAVAFADGVKSKRTV